MPDAISDLPVASGINLLDLLRVGQYDGTASPTERSATVTQLFAKLPIATPLGLGVVSVGSGLNIDIVGALSVPLASTGQPGLIKTGTGGLSVLEDGTLTVPTATSGTTGTVKIGNGILAANDGTISLLTASSTQLGAVKVGTGLAIDASGFLSVTGIPDAPTYNLPAATSSTLGGVIAGTGLSVNGAGLLTVNFPSNYSLPPASGSTLGGIKVGASLSAAGDGTLSVNNATTGQKGVVRVGSGLQVSSGLASIAPATSDTIGGVKPGTNCTVAVDGTLNVSDGSYTLPNTTTTVLGGMITGNGLQVNSGVVSVIYGSDPNTAASGADSRIAGAAPLNNPVFTGNARLTASPATNDDSTSIASTGFVKAQNYLTAASAPAATTSTKGQVIVGAGLSVNSGIVSVAYGTTSGTAVEGNDSRLISAAPLASPTFTGVPTAPTASAGTNTQQLATTAFVLSQGFLTSASLADTYALVDAPAFTGNPTRTVQPLLTSSDSSLATTQFVQNKIAALALGSPTLIGLSDVNIVSPTLNQALVYNGTDWANLAVVNTISGRSGAISLTIADVTDAAGLNSPAFFGIPTAPTANIDTDTNQLATTEFVMNQNYLKSSAAVTTYAPLASPALTGVPTAPTALVSENSGMLATTSWVRKYLASLEDAPYAGDGTPGIVRDDGTGIVTTVNAYPMEAWNVQSPPTTSTFTHTFDNAVSVIAVRGSTPGAGAAGSNYETVTFKKNGSTAGTTFTANVSSTSLTFSAPISFAAGDVLSVTATATGTIPTLYLQMQVNWA